MKTNDYLLLSGTLAYSLLFFEQNAGINFLIFDAVFISIALIRSPHLVKHLRWALSALLCLMSGMGIALHASSLALFSNVIALLVLSGLSFNPSTSVIFSLLFSGFTLLTSPVMSVFDVMKRYEDTGERQKIKENYKVLMALLVLSLALLFFFLFKQANPLFAENTKWINLDFISWKWLFFTLSGFFVGYGFIYHKTFHQLKTWEEEQTTFLKKPVRDSTRFVYERYAGVLLFALLNLMLLILNAGDITSIWFNGALPNGVSHSDFVHNGVGIVMLSIILAVALILYLFRFNFEDIKNSRALQLMIYIWLVQNLVMLYSTACRNTIYVSDFNLTYKRMGVYIWLFLAAIGLFILFLQVKNKRDIWFLTTTNFLTWQLALSFGALVNWDNVITDFNLRNQPLKKVDLLYLVSLSDSNIPQLLEVLRSNEFKTLKNNATTCYDKYYQTSLPQQFRERLTSKMVNYVHYHNNDWRSASLRNYKINQALITIKTKKKI